MKKAANRIRERLLGGEEALRYFLFEPSAGSANAPVLVTVHGISRNAATHARRFSHLAERYGVVMAAPLFDEQRYPGYQRLGLRGQRADLALNRLLDEVTQLTGADTERVFLFGYSGGGQFVHRYAMAYPHRVAAIAIGAAGWYTFPDPTRRFPYGIGPHPKLPGMTFQAAAFLSIPAYVLVGKEDTTRDKALRQSSNLDQQQGHTRFERGQRWVSAMEQAARRHGLDTEFRFIALPETDHSFSRSVKAGGMAERVFQRFFSHPTLPVRNRPCPLPSPQVLSHEALMP
ncbi:MAG: PHB depolymerase family esterase [Pseudomonadota bacterium]